MPMDQRLLIPRRRAPAIPFWETPALVAILSHTWWLNHASGDALDPTGSLTLANSDGPVAYDEFLWGQNGADFEADDTEYFEVADTASVRGGDTLFGMGCWILPETKQGQLFSKYQPAGNLREYNIGIDASNAYFTVTSDGTSGTAIFVQVAIPNDGQPHYISAGHDPTNNVIWVGCDESIVTNSHSGGVFAGASSFRLGARPDNSNYYDGKMQQAIFARGELRPFISGIVNGGAGQPSPTA